MLEAFNIFKPLALGHSHFFPLRTVKKPLSTRLKISQKHRTSNYLFANRKNPTHSGSCLYVLLFLHTAKNPFYYSQNKYLKTSYSKLSILKLGKNATFGPLPCCFFSFTHCQKLPFRSKNAATLITVSIRKKCPLRLIAVRGFTLHALSKIIFYTQFQNLIHSLPQQLGFHTVPIIGENLQ